MHNVHNIMTYDFQSYAIIYAHISHAYLDITSQDIYMTGSLPRQPAMFARAEMRRELALAMKTPETCKKCEMI